MLLFTALITIFSKASSIKGFFIYAILVHYYQKSYKNISVLWQNCTKVIEELFIIIP